MTTALARRRKPARPGKSAKAVAARGIDIELNGEYHIPAWVVDHDSYRRWARSDDYPESGRFAFLNGTIWIDLTMEQLFSHNAVKTRITSALDNLVSEAELGYLFSDGTLVSHPGAGLSTEPDACFVTYDSVASGAVKWVEGAKEGYVEVEGAPDMVLEIVSDSSVTKDTADLRELYWQAGVKEYWLVDARGQQLKFSLLKHTARGYVESRRQADGWVKSAVFGKSFSLTQGKDRFGKPLFSLQAR